MFGERPVPHPLAFHKGEGIWTFGGSASSQPVPLLTPAGDAMSDLLTNRWPQQQELRSLNAAPLGSFLFRASPHCWTFSLSAPPGGELVCCAGGRKCPVFMLVLMWDKKGIADSSKAVFSNQLGYWCCAFHGLNTCFYFSVGCKLGREGKGPATYCTFTMVLMSLVGLMLLDQAHLPLQWQNQIFVCGFRGKMARSSLDVCGSA